MEPSFGAQALCVASQLSLRDKGRLTGWGGAASSLQTRVSWALGGLHREPQEQLRNPLFELELSVGNSQIMRVEQGFFSAVVSLFPVTQPFWCKG